MHERDEACWQRQEDARLGRGGDAADRLVARALAQPPAAQLPDGFAEALARLARQRARAASPGFEWALHALAAALVLLASALAFAFNPGLAPALLSVLQAQGLGGWVLWLGAGLIATALVPVLATQRRPA